MQPIHTRSCDCLGSSLGFWGDLAIQKTLRRHRSIYSIDFLPALLKPPPLVPFCSSGNDPKTLVGFTGLQGQDWSWELWTICVTNRGNQRQICRAAGTEQGSSWWRISIKCTAALALHRRYSYSVYSDSVIPIWFFTAYTLCCSAFLGS